MVVTKKIIPYNQQKDIFFKAFFLLQKLSCTAQQVHLTADVTHVKAETICSLQSFQRS